MMVRVGREDEGGEAGGGERLWCRFLGRGGGWLTHRTCRGYPTLLVKIKIGVYSIQILG